MVIMYEDATERCTVIKLPCNFDDDVLGDLGGTLSRAPFGEVVSNVPLDSGVEIDD